MAISSAGRVIDLPKRKRRVRPLPLVLDKVPMRPEHEREQALGALRAAWAYRQLEFLAYDDDEAPYLQLAHLFFRWTTLGWKTCEEANVREAVAAIPSALHRNYCESPLELIQRPLNDSGHLPINDAQETDHLIAFHNAVFSALTGELVDEDPQNVLAYAPVVAYRNRILWDNLPRALTTLAEQGMFGSIARLVKPIPDHELQRLLAHSSARIPV